MAGELTNLESRYVARYQDIAVRTPLDDDLRLIGGRTGFISGLVVHCVFQLATIGCDLKKDVEELITKAVLISQLRLIWDLKNYLLTFLIQLKPSRLKVDMSQKHKNKYMTK